MAHTVFLTPCDPADFERTVLEAVDLGGHPDRPAVLEGLDAVRFWGARDGKRNAKYVGLMEAGDLVLFYHDGEYVGGGTVETTFEDVDRWASETFSTDAQFAHVYTLEDVEALSVPKRAINRIFNYSTDYYPQGLIRVAEHKVTNRPSAIKLALRKLTGRYG